MIHCSHCNNDNDIGAIFCRSCGEKIDTDSIKPEQFGGKGKRKKKGFSMGQVMQGLRNLIGVFLVLILGVSFFLLFMTPDFRAHDEMEDKDATYTLRLLTGAIKRGSHSFTEAQATQISRKMVYLLEEDREDDMDTEVAALAPISITINLLPQNRARIILESSLKEKVTMYTILEGSVTATPAGLDFSPEKAWSGKFPLHTLGDFGLEVAIKRMEGLVKGKPRYDKIKKDVFAGLRTVTIDGTKITLQR